MAQPPPQHGIQLAVNIISTDFGNLVAKVCECLLRRGYITKAQISNFTELSHDKVKKGLWVLIQHNCVQAFALEQEGGGRETTVVTHYMAVFNNIIHRLRFSKFLNEVPKELDKKAAGILDGLLHHGRLTLTQILDRAMDSKTEEDDANRYDYNEIFSDLVRNRLVERCPAAEPLIPLPTDEENSKQSRPKARKYAKKEVTLEERALAAATPMDAERFSIGNEHAGDSDEDGNGSNVPQAKVGEKRKQDKIEQASDFDLLEAKGEPVWRVNFEEFTNRLRKTACVEFVRATYDNATAVILRSMLEGTKITDDTVSMSLDDVFEEVVKNEEGPAMDLEQVRCSLDQLPFCFEVDDKYTIKLMDIIEKARLEEIESLILKRFGNEAFRIFRSLSASRALHTDQISEKTLTDKKDTPKILYRLWQDGFLGMEKVATGGSKQADFIFWNVKTEKVCHKLLDELYHAALNLSLRSAHEVEQFREVTAMIKSASKVPAELQAKKVRGHNIYFTLNASLLELDDAIMLFSDFLI